MNAQRPIGVPGGGGETAADAGAAPAAPPVLVFRVGGAWFASEVAHVREVIVACEVARASFMPEFFEGVVEIRGTLIPIVDLRKRFEVEVRPDRKRNRIVLIGIEGRILGALVDEVDQVVDLAGVPLMPPPPLAEGLNPKFLMGVFAHRGEVVYLLDLREILTSAEKTSFHALDSPAPAAAAPRGEGAEEGRP